MYPYIFQPRVAESKAYKNKIKVTSSTTTPEALYLFSLLYFYQNASNLKLSEQKRHSKITTKKSSQQVKDHKERPLVERFNSLGKFIAMFRLSFYLWNANSFRLRIAQIFCAMLKSSIDGGEANIKNRFLRAFFSDLLTVKISSLYSNYQNLNKKLHHFDYKIILCVSVSMWRRNKVGSKLLFGVYGGKQNA